MAKKMTIKKHVLQTYYGLKIILLLNEDTGVFQCQTSVTKKLRKGVDMIGQVTSWRDSILLEYNKRTGIDVYRLHESLPLLTRWLL
jgi:hypothetical protein